MWQPLDQKKKKKRAGEENHKRVFTPPAQLRHGHAMLPKTDK